MSTLASIAAFANIVPAPGGTKDRRRTMWRASGLLQEAANTTIEADALSGLADDYSMTDSQSDRFHNRSQTYLFDALTKAREAVAILEALAGDETVEKRT